MVNNKNIGKHRVMMNERQSISITGVLDVISFDEVTIVADTELGVLILTGYDLHVIKLNLEEGELDVDGRIISIAYEEEGILKQNQGSFLSRIFK